MDFYIKQLFDLLLYQQNQHIINSHTNPINQAGKKSFSQNEEDGIILEILRRLNVSQGTFVEFGVGNGSENNTLTLLSLGWSGAWVGAEKLCFDYQPKPWFRFYDNWIDLSTLPAIMSTIGQELQITVPDVFSVDLDGNDYYIVEDLLQHGIRPKMWIVEYNSKFIPPVDFKIDYDPTFKWAGSDYFGASLSSFNGLFERYNYRLVACNALTGSNAFFVDRAYDDKFVDIPTDINKLYAEPRYFLYNNHGFKVDPRTIEKIINR